MKRFLLCLLLIGPTTGFAQSGGPVADAAALAGLTTLREGLITSFNQGDIEHLLALLDPEVAVTWQNGEVSHGREEVRAYYNRMMKGDHPVVKEIKVEPEILGRQFNGDWVVTWGNLHDHIILNDGSDLPLNSVFTVTSAKRGDRWLVVSYHASVNMFDNPVIKTVEHQVAIWVGAGSLAVGLVLGALLGRMGKRKRPVGV